MSLSLSGDPFPALEEIKRVLKTIRVFQRYDWVRTSLEAYLVRDSSGAAGTDRATLRRRQLKLFSCHNHYSSDDWTWVLEKARFDLIADALPCNKHHRLFAATPRPQA